MATNKEDNKVEEIIEVSTPSRAEEILEDPLASAETFYNQHKNLVNIALGVVLAGVLAFAGWKYYVSEQEKEAQSSMFQSVYYFEADSLKKALNGDGNYPGLVEIADDYGFTKAGNLAKFYTGVIYLKQGNFEEAITYLKGFSSSDLILQARAYALTGDAYLEQKNYADAANYYEKAANYKPNKEFSPLYLLKLVMAQDKNGDQESALETCKQILKKYPNSSQVTEAKRYQGELESRLGK